MPPMEPNFIYQVLLMVFAIGGSWAAVRSDIKHLIEKTAEMRDSVNDAHKRLDAHITDYHRRNDD